MAQKITQSQIKEFVKDKLANDPRWAQRALLKIFEFQTEDEQEHEHTYNHNNVGFTGIDGYILTSFAKQLIKYKRLSEKQMAIVYKKMPKYWKQIISISDEEQLKSLILR